MELRLTKTEMEILQYLIINRRNILTHAQIFSEIYGREHGETSSDALNSSLKRLRRKIKDLAQFDYIENVRDVGYRLIALDDKSVG